MKISIFDNIQIDSFYMGMNDYYLEQGEDEHQEKFDLSKIDSMEFDDVDHSDYPDFCDAYCSAADYDGEPMTEDELADLNENHRDFVYERLISKLF
jgi:hypothetical protein